MKFLTHDRKAPVVGPYAVFVDEDGNRYAIADVVLASLPKVPQTTDPDRKDRRGYGSERR